MTPERARDVNRRMCLAYMVWQGITEESMPDVSDISLAEARAAALFIQQENAALSVGGKKTLHSFLAERAIAPTLIQAIAATMDKQT